jgi:hypothetical protein
LKNRSKEARKNCPKLGHALSKLAFAQDKSMGYLVLFGENMTKTIQ